MDNLSLCSRCQERPAVLFIAGIDGGTETKGYCLQCASKLGITQVDNMIDQMGLTPDDLDRMEKEMSDMLGGIDFGELQKMAANTSPEDMQNAMKTLNEALTDQQEEIPTADGLPSETLSEDDDEVLEDIDSEEETGKNAIGPQGFFTQMSQQMNQIFGEMGGPSNQPSADGLESTTEEKSHRGSSRKEKKKKEKKRKFLDNFCDDLTQKARDGKLDRIIGRDKETDRAIQILNRRSKNNPCLIGEPGVGKTAIAEGMALRIAAGEVPYRLRDKEIFQLDLTSLVAGTQFRGQFESRVKGLLEEVRDAGNIILFVDEVHNLVGAGESEGAMSAANIFKPALSRGEIQVIGATTFTEYRKYIEKDTALERRFQPIKIEEPNQEESIEVLMGIKGYYEDYHRVVVPDSIIRDSVILSERYITDRFLPDKAIDLLDEACSSRALTSQSLERFDALTKELLVNTEELDELENATEMDYEAIANVKAEISRIQENLTEVTDTMDDNVVTDEDIAKVIELWTGVSSAKVRESELGKVAGLENKLKARVVGQDEACEMVAAAIKRNRVQISSRRRPASFIFVGPTAVGKTELVKVLADELFDTPDPLIRLDMSEYMEQHSVSKMIGSPPGYVGYDEAGQLTEKVRRKPYSVILMDEIEKAHPNVLNILLQVLDEGHITDSQGRKVNFENTVIVMTSNAGSHNTDSSIGFNKSASDISKEKAMKALNEFLRPEFVSRVDEIVVFNQLTEENYADIAKLMLTELEEPLSERGITFAFDRPSCENIGHKAYGSPTGARGIRKIIRREVEDTIANLIVENPTDYPKKITLTVEEGDLHLLTE